MKINKEQWKWTREPKQYSISEDKIEIITNPHTDLWQRTYYHFRNDNAPVLQIKTSCIKLLMKYSLEFMLAARKIHPLRLYLPIWN